MLSKLLGGRAAHSVRVFSSAAPSRELLYPKQILVDENRFVRATLKGGVDKDLLKRSRAMMCISIGQEVHSRQCLAAAISMVNESFDECVFMLADTLQAKTKPNYHLGTSEVDFIESERAAGARWIEENSSMFMEMRIPWTVLRWDTIVSHPTFHPLLERLRSECESDLEFRRILEENCDIYIDRNSERFEIPMEQARENTREYFLTESAAIPSLMGYGCPFHLYPSSRPPFVEEVYRRHAEDYPQNLIIRFKKVTADHDRMSPQNNGRIFSDEQKQLANPIKNPGNIPR